MLFIEARNPLPLPGCLKRSKPKLQLDAEVMLLFAERPLRSPSSLKYHFQQIVKTTFYSLRQSLICLLDNSVLMTRTRFEEREARTRNRTPADFPANPHETYVQLTKNLVSDINLLLETWQAAPESPDPNWKPTWRTLSDDS